MDFPEPKSESDFYTDYKVYGPIAATKTFRFHELELPWFVEHCRIFYPQLDDLMARIATTTHRGPMFEYGFMDNTPDCVAMVLAYEDLKRARGANSILPSWWTRSRRDERVMEWSMGFRVPTVVTYDKKQIYEPWWMMHDYSGLPHQWTTLCWWYHPSSVKLLEARSYKGILEKIKRAQSPYNADPYLVMMFHVDVRNAIDVEDPRYRSELAHGFHVLQPRMMY